MKKIKYLFISRVSSHYRYYRKLTKFLGDDAHLQKLKFFAFPRPSFFSQVNDLDLDDLVNVHVERKKVRHPILNTNPILLGAITRYYRFIEKCRASYYFSYFSSHDIDTVIVWNGMKQPNKTPYEVAKACGIKTQLFENGLLPNTTVLDPKGVNALNSMPRDASFYLNWDSGSTEKSELSSNLVKRAPHKNRKSDDAQVTLPERFIFVPFQVPNDTQIVCHSPWIKSMEAFYEELEKAVNFMDSDVKFVVKEHPSWPRSFVDLHHKNPQIIFANNNETSSLIQESEAVLTINSTVGIEALLLNKKVITLGNTFLNIQGLVKHCESSKELADAITELKTWNFDPILRVQFLDYLANEYLIKQSWNNLSNEQAHFSEVKTRLENPYQVD